MELYSTIHIPNEMTYTEDETGIFAFSALEHVYLFDQITKICHGMFKNCKNLHSIFLNNGLTMLESECFHSSGL